MECVGGTGRSVAWVRSLFDLVKRLERAGDCGRESVCDCKSLRRRKSLKKKLVKKKAEEPWTKGEEIKKNMERVGKLIKKEGGG